MSTRERVPMPQGKPIFEPLNYLAVIHDDNKI